MRDGLLNKTNLCLLLTLWFWGVLLYLNTVQNPFVYDDLSYIVYNSNIKDITDFSSIWNALNRPSRFVGYLTFAANYHIHRLDVFGYHVVNICIHLINTALVWWLVMLIFKTPSIKNQPIAQNKSMISFFVAMLFLVHPVQTEAVTYITQRFACLATLFYVASVCFYMKGRLHFRGQLPKKRGLTPVYFLLSGLMAVLGMFTKEIVLTLPVAIILFEFSFLRGKQKNRLPGWAWLVICSFLLLVPALYKFKWSILLMHIAESGSHTGDSINSGLYFLTQFEVVAKYIRLLFVPLGQNLLYDIPVSKSFFEQRTIMSFTLLFGVFVTAIFMFKRNRLIAAGIFWFFLTLLVESSIIPIRHVIFEHRMYLPSVGFSISFVVAIFTISKNKKIAAGILCAIILCFSFLTIERNKIWRSPISLWHDVVQKSPKQLKGHLNLGVAYAKNGQHDKAIETYTELLKIQVNAEAFGNRGNIYNRMGKYEQAIADYKKALAIKPYSSQIHNNQGDAYFSMGEYDRAITDYSKAIGLNPKYFTSYKNRAQAYRVQGKMDLALIDFDKAIKLNPHYIASYNGKGAIYFLSGRYQLAADNYSKVLDINPQHVGAYINRGSCYSELTEFDLSLLDYNKAIHIQPDNGQIYYNRGILFKKTGRKNLAEHDFKKAKALGYEIVRVTH